MKKLFALLALFAFAVCVTAPLARADSPPLRTESYFMPASVQAVDAPAVVQSMELQSNTTAIKQPETFKAIPVGGQAYTSRAEAAVQIDAVRSGFNLCNWRPPNQHLIQYRYMQPAEYPLKTYSLTALD